MQVSPVSIGEGALVLSGGAAALVTLAAAVVCAIALMILLKNYQDANWSQWYTNVPLLKPEAVQALWKTVIVESI